MKVYSYHISREERIRKHVEDVAVNGGRILMAQIETIEAKMETIGKTSNSRFDYINDKLDNYLGGKRG